MEATNSIDAYSYLWDGSEDWGLIAHHNSQSLVMLSIAELIDPN